VRHVIHKRWRLSIVAHVVDQTEGLEVCIGWDLYDNPLRRGVTGIQAATIKILVVGRFHLNVVGNLVVVSFESGLDAVTKVPASKFFPFSAIGLLQRKFKIYCHVSCSGLNGLEEES
jgi:hypothetical protein